MHPCWWKILFGLQNRLMGSEISWGGLRASLRAPQGILHAAMEKNQCPQRWARGGDLPGRRAPPMSLRKQQEGAGV